MSEPQDAGTGVASRQYGGASRRQVLGATLAAGAVLGTGGWRSVVGRASQRVSGRKLRKPGSLPHPHLRRGTDTIPQIKHIVVLMMENHSYDNHLGMLGRAGADGFPLGANGKPTATNPYGDGRIQHAFRMPTTCQLRGKPSQTWHDSHTQFASAKLNGFVRSGSGPVSMGYWEKADLPFYYSLASTFPIADRYFASVLGQTFPNRRYLIAGTSLGMINDTVPGLLEYPAHGTIFDSLDNVGVSFADYYQNLPLATMELFPELIARHPEGLHGMGDFFEAAKKGTLPGFSIVEPNYLKNSEEDPQNVAYGEQLASSVIDAVMHGPGWKNTLLIWTFDEHGGYYDHVVPPRAIAPDNIGPKAPSGQAYNGFHQYGFRVPCALISPWARRDYVSHTVFDHTSITALVETKWNLPAMTYRDANAHNMLDMLDLSSPAFLKPPALAKPLLTAEPAHATACNMHGPGTIPPAGSVTGP